MTRLNLSKARDELPEIVSRAAHRGERTIPMKDLRLLKRLAEAKMNRGDLENARAALAEPGANNPWEKIKADSGL